MKEGSFGLRKINEEIAPENGGLRRGFIDFVLSFGNKKAEELGNLETLAGYLNGEDLEIFRKFQLDELTRDEFNAYRSRQEALDKENPSGVAYEMRKRFIIFMATQITNKMARELLGEIVLSRRK